jgi:hypothetical protein
MAVQKLSRHRMWVRFLHQPATIQMRVPVGIPHASKHSGTGRKTVKSMLTAIRVYFSCARVFDTMFTTRHLRTSSVIELTSRTVWLRLTFASKNGNPP